MNAHLRMSATGLLAGGALALALLGCARDRIVTTCAGPLEILVSPAATTIPVGGTATFTVRVTGGFCSDPAPAFTWSVSDAVVATIASKTDSSVAVRGLAAGHLTVTASAVSDPQIRSAGLLTVFAGPPPALVP